MTNPFHWLQKHHLRIWASLILVLSPLILFLALCAFILECTFDLIYIIKKATNGFVWSVKSEFNVGKDNMVGMFKDIRKALCDNEKKD